LTPSAPDLVLFTSGGLWNTLRRSGDGYVLRYIATRSANTSGGAHRERCGIQAMVGDGMVEGDSEA